MTKTIFARMFGGYVLVVVALSALIVTLAFGVVREHYMRGVVVNLEKLGLTMAPAITPYVLTERYDELNEYSRQLGEQINTRITVIDPTGRVLTDSERNPVTMENHKNRPEIEEALTGNIGTFTRYSTTVKEDMVYVAIPLKQDQQIVGVLRISRFEKDIHHLLQDLKGKIFELTGIVMLLALGIAFLFSRTLTKPIRDLREAFQRVASGDFDAKVYLAKKDETKELADSFNAMTDQIKTLFTELSRQKDSLNNIIASVQAGLVLLDKNGTIVRSNKNFEKIVRNQSVTGKFYWEVIRESRFSDLIKKVSAEKNNVVREIDFAGRTYLCSGAFLDASEETVVIVHDITELKNIEKVKKDFVVNVSHELRTPLTAIKGFAETLEDEVSDDARRYIDVIKRNTDRLIYIIQDLLVLSELEEKGDELAHEDVDVSNVIEHVTRIFKPLLYERGLELISKVTGPPPVINGDAFRLEQLLINLIDNAFKYTEKGTITLTTATGDDSIEITVEDTGIGISQEHLPRLFERFYVVDKSRSKKCGGTGLGLSIVKHIVLLHNGDIQVESVLGIGTKFIVTLPIKPS